MLGTNFLNRLAITSRRQGLTTAVVYGLSLAVRFTSAAGEGAEIPAWSVPPAASVMSVLSRDAAPLPFQSSNPNFATPIVFRYGWPPSSPSSASGCSSP